jgi:hypothetical protein
MRPVWNLLLAARECSDEAAIAVRSYQPVSHTVEEGALRQLKNARQRLEMLGEKVQKLIEEVNESYPGLDGVVSVVEIMPLQIASPLDRSNLSVESGSDARENLTLSFFCEGEAPFDPSGKTEVYLLESPPRPLLGPFERRWVARVRGAEGVGILLYELTRKIAFFYADEAITVLACLMEEAVQLLPYTDSQLFEQYQEALEALRQGVEQDDELQALLLLLCNGGGGR